MPVGAFGGRADLMRRLAPEGPVYQAGTLSGNPVAMAAGPATLQALAAPGVYETLERRTPALDSGLRDAPARRRLAGTAEHARPQWGPDVAPRAAGDYAAA